MNESYENIKFERIVEEEKSNNINFVPSYVEIDGSYRTDEYKNCLKELQLSKETTNAIYKGIKKIFSNKSKITNEKTACSVEGIYLLDLNDLNETFYKGDGKPAAANRPTESIEYMLNNKNSDMLVIHNHRGDSVPSSTDIEQLCRLPNNRKGIVVGNKGNIFYYEVTKKIDKVQLEEYSKYEEQDDVKLKYNEFVKFCNNNGIIFKHLRKAGEKYDF